MQEAQAGSEEDIDLPHSSHPRHQPQEVQGTLDQVEYAGVVSCGGA